MEEIKATDCIIKVHITSGNIKWRSFALRFYASNHKSTWQPLLPSAKGLSFILVLYLIQESWWSSPFLFTLYPLASTLFWKDPDIYIQLDVSYHELLLLTLTQYLWVWSFNQTQRNIGAYSVASQPFTSRVMSTIIVHANLHPIGYIYIYQDLSNTMCLPKDKM